MLRGVQLSLLAALALAVGCKPAAAPPAAVAAAQGIRIDGSSTVQPLSTAMAGEFKKSHPDFPSPTVGQKGTSGGFQLFSAGEIDISDASRPIKDKELEACKANGIEPVELKVAIDGLSVVVHKDNDWCTGLTVKQLNALWTEGSTIKKWSDLNPEWPAEEIVLFGPDDKSGTYDYFKEEILGKEGKFREDYSPSSDDNVLVNGVAGSKFAIGYFGYSYMIENQDVLRPVAISNTDNPADAVLPSQETIENDSYKPLARPLFIYVSKEGLKNAVIKDFCEFYLSDAAQEIVKIKQYIGLNAEQLEASRQALQAALAE